MHRSTARLLKAALIAVALAAVPSAAQAATVSDPIGILFVEAAPGETNNIRVFTENGELTVTDSVPIRAGAGCRSFEPRKVRCGTGSEFFDFRLGDGNDSMLVKAPLSGTVDGGRGDDLFHTGTIPAARPSPTAAATSAPRSAAPTATTRSTTAPRTVA
jgi:hypothetical protein